MNDTCKGKMCWLYILMRDLVGENAGAINSHSNMPELILDVRNCPFYQEKNWTPDPVNGVIQHTKTVHDCVNIRMYDALLLFVWPRLLGLQQSNESQRNEAVKIFDTFKTIAERINEERSKRFLSDP